MSKKTYYITFTAVFAALGIAMNLLSSFMPRVDTFGRISLVYAFCFLTGCVLGPYLGAGVAAIADFLPAIIFPEGPWMPLITLSNAVMALIAGLFYKYLPTKSVAVKISLAASGDLCRVHSRSYHAGRSAALRYGHAGLLPHDDGACQQRDVRLCGDTGTQSGCSVVLAAA